LSPSGRGHMLAGPVGLLGHVATSGQSAWRTDLQTPRMIMKWSRSGHRTSRN